MWGGALGLDVDVGFKSGLDMAHIGFKMVFSGPPLRESCLNYIHTNSNLPHTLPSMIHIRTMYSYTSHPTSIKSRLSPHSW